MARKNQQIDFVQQVLNEANVLNFCGVPVCVVKEARGAKEKLYNFGGLIVTAVIGCKINNEKDEFAFITLTLNKTGKVVIFSAQNDCLHVVVHVNNKEPICKTISSSDPNFKNIILESIDDKHRKRKT